MFTKFKKIIRKRERWSIGIFKEESLLSMLDTGLSRPVKIIGENGFRLSKKYTPTVADPFLFVYKDRLYLFYECQTDHAHGAIHVQSMSLDGQWYDHGQIINESFHLSYPQVFSFAGSILMIPEAAQSGKVLLYEAVDFPTKWRVRSTLIDNGLRDPTLFISDNEEFYILSTTENYELKIHCADSIDGPFKDSGRVITRDRRFARCAGTILKVGDLLIRPAQDCSEVYGKRILLQEIVNISLSSYQEAPSDISIKLPEYKWLSRGTHHISTAQFGNSTWVAIDGRCYDLVINSFILAFIRLAERIYKTMLVK